METRLLVQLILGIVAISFFSDYDDDTSGELCMVV